MKKSICIMGLGYIGLPTAAMFASRGHHITGVDVNSKVVDSLNKGEITIYEPYLDTLVQASVTSGNLCGSTVPVKADAFIIAVPTPIRKDHTADMSFVESATRSIVPFLEKGNIVILESTSPPGTVRDLMMPILAESGLNPETELLVAHSPERVLPGRILIELVENNRIVGGINQESSDAVKELYQSFVTGNILTTDSTTAEMCKLMENTYRDVNIALANELAKICESMGISAWDVIQLANMHPRVNIHQPGPGVGGHCLAVDPWFIVEKHPELASLIRMSRETNDSMPEYVYKKCMDILSPVKGTKHITLMGITYKPDIDDTRESPVIELYHLLQNTESVKVTVLDPHVASFSDLETDPEKAFNGAHLAVLGANHQAFQTYDYEALAKVMALPQMLDTRNCLDRGELAEMGMICYLLGDGHGGISQ